MREALHGGVGIQVRALILRGWRNTTLSVLIRPLRSSTPWTPFFFCCLRFRAMPQMARDLTAGYGFDLRSANAPSSLLDNITPLSCALHMACLEYHGYSQPLKRVTELLRYSMPIPMRLKQSTTAYHDPELSF